MRYSIKAKRFYLGDLEAVVKLLDRNVEFDSIKLISGLFEFFSRILNFEP